jgi:hypothetical protein
VVSESRAIVEEECARLRRDRDLSREILRAVEPYAPTDADCARLALEVERLAGQIASLVADVRRMRGDA